MRLWDRFTAFGAPQGSLEFISERIDGWAGFRLAKDRAGRPALLIEHGREAATGTLPNVELRFVSFWPATACEIGSGDSTESGVFAIVRSKADELAVQQLFLGVLGSWIETLGSAPSLSSVRSGFERLAALFEALAEVGTGDAIGLWGELLLIACASKPETVVRAWHADVRELYDFCSGTSAIEVKTTATRIRRHDFSLQQLTPPGDHRLAVASFVLDATGETISLSDLVSVVKSQLQHPELRLRVDEIVTSTLGGSWREGVAVRFNPVRSIVSLRFFRDADIPCVARDLPAEVSDVRFKVELDGVDSLDVREVASASAFHGAVVPATRGAVEARFRS